MDKADTDDTRQRYLMQREASLLKEVTDMQTRLQEIGNDLQKTICHMATLVRSKGIAIVSTVRDAMVLLLQTLASLLLSFTFMPGTFTYYGNVKKVVKEVVKEVVNEVAVKAVKKGNIE